MDNYADGNMGEADNREALQRLYSRLARDGGKVTGHDVLDFTRQVKLFHILATSLRVTGSDQLQEAVSYTLFEKFIASLSRHCFPQADSSAEDQLLAYMRLACFTRYRVMLGAPHLSSSKRTKRKQRSTALYPYEKPTLTPRNAVSSAQLLNQKVSRLYSLVTPRNKCAPSLHHSFMPQAQRTMSMRTISGAQTCRLPEDPAPMLPLFDPKGDPEPPIISKIRTAISRFQVTLDRLRREPREDRQRKRALMAAIRAGEMSKRRVRSTQKTMLKIGIVRWRLAITRR